MGSGGAPALWPPGRANHPATAARRGRRAAGHGLAAGRAAGRVVLASFWHGPAAVRLPLGGVEVDRAIRTGQLHALPRFHTRPIDVVVCHGSDGETWF